MLIQSTDADDQEYTYQATLFYNSMSAPEKQNMISAAQFELSKCEEHIVHQNTINRFNEIDHDFALAVAEVFPAVTVPEGKPNHGQRSDFLSQITGKNQGKYHFLQSDVVLTISLHC